MRRSLGFSNRIGRTRNAVSALQRIYLMNMTLSQILALVGELDDSPGNETPRERFRRFLKDNAKDGNPFRKCSNPERTA
jgi:hypothetical protein